MFELYNNYRKVIYRSVYCIFSFTLLCLFSGSVFSQANKDTLLTISRVENLEFDGHLNELFWEDLPALSFIQYSPIYNFSPTEKSLVYLVYDNKYLYLSGRLYVSNPDFIRGQTYKRDGYNPSTDYFGLVLDSYNDNENGLAFFTSPTGFRFDAAISNDATGENFISDSWNTYWEVKTYVSDSFFDVEIRIPWSSLKFEVKDGRVEMGVTIWRYIAAKNEMSLFPDISPDLGKRSNWKSSLMQDIVFEDVTPSNPLYLTPYVLLGQQRDNVLSADGSEYELGAAFNYNLGLDAKYNLTSNLTLDLSINTDFAQVESDDEQINLTRYELFLPEKRQFFQERASLFDFRFNYINRLFYSRNIGIKDGRAAPILGGLRLTGRIGNMDVGLISMQTGSPGITFFDNFNRENIADNYSVIRFKNRVFNPYSYVGGMITNKTNFKGEQNTAYGLDGVFRVWGNDYLTLKWAQTFENGMDANPFSLDPSRFLIGMERRIFSGFSYNVNIGSTGKDFNPGLGFQTRNDYLFYQTFFNYGIIFNDDSRFQDIRFTLGSWGDKNYALNKIDQASVFSTINLQSKKAWSYRLSSRYSYDILLEPLQLSDEIDIPEGSYSYAKAEVEITTSSNARMGISARYETGTYFDGDINSLRLEPRWNPNAHLEMSAVYELNNINFKERNEKLISHIFRLRTLYMLNAKLSINAFIQYNNASNLFISNIKLRYNPREGNDLYLVFNEILNADRMREVPNYPLLNTEVFALKYTYTFKVD